MSCTLRPELPHDNSHRRCMLSFSFVIQKARFEKGKELLEAEFRNLLTRYSKPVPPILILDALTVDDELEVQEEVMLEHLPEAVLQDIICISGWLVEYGRNQGTWDCTHKRMHTHTHRYARVHTHTHFEVFHYHPKKGSTSLCESPLQCTPEAASIRLS